MKLFSLPSNSASITNINFDGNMPQTFTVPGKGNVKCTVKSVKADRNDSYGDDAVKARIIEAYLNEFEGLYILQKIEGRDYWTIIQ